MANSPASAFVTRTISGRRLLSVGLVIGAAIAVHQAPISAVVPSGHFSKHDHRRLQKVVHTPYYPRTPNTEGYPAIIQFGHFHREGWRKLRTVTHVASYPATPAPLTAQGYPATVQSGHFHREGWHKLRTAPSSPYYLRTPNTEGYPAIIQFGHFHREGWRKLRTVTHVASYPATPAAPSAQGYPDFVANGYHWRKNTVRNFLQPPVQPVEWIATWLVLPDYPAPRKETHRTVRSVPTHVFAVPPVPPVLSYDNNIRPSFLTVSQPIGKRLLVVKPSPVYPAASLPPTQPYTSWAPTPKAIQISFDRRLQKVALNHFPVAPVFDGPNINNMVFIIGVAISSQDFSSLFSGAGPLTFTMVGSLPAGLNLSSAGVLSGTPTVLGGTSALEVKATSGAYSTDSNTFSITIIGASSGGGRRWHRLGHGVEA